jgi:hypothetical protein
MSEFDGLNGKARGAEYVRRMREYLGSASELPLLNGSVNVSAIAEAARIPTQSIYKNPTIRAALEDAKARFGVQSWGENTAPPLPEGKAQAVEEPNSAVKVQRLEKRLSDLEQRYSAVVAENYELRQQLKETRLQLAREDMMIETGRRVAAPKA